MNRADIQALMKGIAPVVADLVLNGEAPWELGGGNVAWAAGGQFRYDRTIQDPDVIYDANATPCVDSPVRPASSP